MSASSSISYPTCYLNNERLILKPGNKFSVNELKTRLNQMNIKMDESQCKIDLINLYEKALKDDNNKLKIFDKLKKDNEFMNINRINKRSVLSSNDADIYNNNNIKQKELNISNNIHDSNHYEYQQEIKLKKNNYSQRNPFVNQDDIYKQNDDTYNEEEEKNNINNNIIENNENLDLTPQYNEINNNDNYDNNNDNKSNMTTSTISLFSGLSNFSFMDKLKINKKEILHQIILGFIIICSALGFLYIYRLFTEPINNFISLILNIISNSGSFITNYWFIIILILLFILIIYILYKNHKIKKICKDIFAKIKKDLNNNKMLSEDDIYRRYVQDMGINQKKFRRNYLPILKKLAKKDKNIKLFEDNTEGKKMIYMEYTY